MSMTQPNPATEAATGPEAIRPFTLRRLGRGARRPAPPRQGDEVARPRDGSRRRACSSRRSRRWPAIGGSGYDWRTFEKRFAALPHFVTRIDGVDIHFIHVRSKHEDALPLIVTHGWPGSTVEQLKIIEPLTDPTAHGAGAADAFHLVIPSLPGHGFSGKPTVTGWDPIRIARAWVVLMQRLGYDALRGPGRRLGERRHRAVGPVEAGRIAGHPHEHAGDGPAGRVEGARHGRPQAGGPVGRRGPGVRDPQALLRDRHRVRRRDGQPPADAVWHRGLAGRPGGLDDRSRRGELQADRPRVRRASRADSRATTSSTTSPTTG